MFCAVSVRSASVKRASARASMRSTSCVSRVNLATMSCATSVRVWRCGVGCKGSTTALGEPVAVKARARFPASKNSQSKRPA